MNHSTTSALSRRAWLALTSSWALYPKPLADNLSGFYYRNYSRCLPDYLSRLAHSAYEKRQTALNALTTPDAIHRRQQWVRETFWRLVGGDVERTPLNPRITGEVQRPGYRLQKIAYESRPGLFVSANLYLPTTGKRSYPGVLFQMGHAVPGKAYPSYQKCCQGLARLGYVVLAFDPMGQGERIAYPKANGTDTRLGSATAEHDVPGKQLLLLGDSATRHQVWDAVRSLDYLAAHELVDPARLASTGQSGGATLTMLLACVDDRLTAVAVSSGNTEDLATADFDAPGSTDDAEQDLINSGPVGFDRWDLLYPIAPKPMLIEVSSHDFFGTYSPRYLEDGRREYQHLENAYRILGKADHLAWRSTPMPHGLTYSLRLGIYNWFERWLKNSDQIIKEEPLVSPEPESTLWVGSTGNVVRDFSSLRTFDLVRSAAAKSPDSPTHDWRSVLPVTPPSSDLDFRILSTVPLNGARISAVEVNSAPEVFIPAWLLAPEKPDSGSSMLLVLDDRGRNHHAHEDDIYHLLARAGRVICAADLRGIGDCRPEVGRGNPEYSIPHAVEEEYAWSSLILGEPLLAQRIADILALAQALRNLPGENRRISIAARGHLTVPALFAFHASGNFDSLYLAGGLVSFQNLLQTEIYTQPLANSAWNLARITDLPQLAAECAPRKICLAGSMDGANNPVSLPEVQKSYGSSNLRLSAAASWDEESLSSV